MSGGSLDYVCHLVDDAADEISRRAETPLHRAFAAHVRLVAKALHDLEWVWSGDYGKGDEEAAIRACLAPGAEVEAATARLREAMDEARALLGEEGT